MLRFEVYLDSPLARFLLRRALRNRRVGLALFWHLRTELDTPPLGIRAAVLLEAYCFGAGKKNSQFNCSPADGLNILRPLMPVPLSLLPPSVPTTQGIC